MEWLTAALDIFKEWWPVLLPLLIPFLTNALSVTEWPSERRMWLAAGLSIVAGFVGAAIAPLPHDPAHLALLLGTFVAETHIAYNVFKANGVTCDWLERLLALGSVRK